MSPAHEQAQDAEHLAPGHLHGLRAWVCAQWQETQMKHTCVALAMIASIPISASASGWTYSESRLSYLNQNSTSDTKRRANLNLGTETGRNQYALRYIQ